MARTASRRALASHGRALSLRTVLATALLVGLLVPLELAWRDRTLCAWLPLPEVNGASTGMCSGQGQHDLWLYTLGLAPSSLPPSDSNSAVASMRGADLALASKGARAAWLGGVVVGVVIFSGALCGCAAVLSLLCYAHALCCERFVRALEVCVVHCVLCACACCTPPAKRVESTAYALRMTVFLTCVRAVCVLCVCCVRVQMLCVVVVVVVCVLCVCVCVVVVVVVVVFVRIVYVLCMCCCVRVVVVVVCVVVACVCVCLCV
ncbi:hypothetical protein T492DRAFT_65298 [Pavlovales sp. CCMP2436]|nr:hypothetical protein T492DRAFT_65298 [Pavlovales sp. CCMP2436]